MSPISVVMPVFNAEQFVGIAIDSVLRQTYVDFELIVVNDGSTDKSLQVINEHIRNDKRGKVFSTTTNRGVVAASNTGLAEAKGTYIFRMDADDVSHPERFSAQMEYLEAHPECVALGTRVLLADQDLMPMLELPAKLTHDDIDATNLSNVGGSALCHGTVGMRRDAALAIGGFREGYDCAEDLDLYLRLAEIGQLAALPRVLYTYRQHLSSIGHARRDQQLQSTKVAIRDARSRRGLAVASECLDPPNTYDSIADIHRKWAWLSLIGGNARTARKHAWKALAMQPFSAQNPRLVACSIRGH